MDATSVLKFSKCSKALGDLEKIFWCKYCDGMYKNAQGDVYSGTVACSCTQTGRRKLTPDWFRNNIIDSVRKVKKAIADDSTQTSEGASNIDEVHTHHNEEKADTNVKQDAEGYKIPFRKENIKRKKRGKFPKEAKLEEKVADDHIALLAGLKLKENTRAPKSENVQPTRQLKELMKRNTKGETKLHTACVKGNKAKVEEFLAAGASPCTKDFAGWTPLHEAVSKGHNDIVRMLVEAGAMVNAPGGFNNSPLHDAALNNNFEAAHLLIKYGANPEVRNIQGYTPRTMADTEEMKAILNDYFPENIISKWDYHYMSHIDIVLFGFGLKHKLQAQLTMMSRQFKVKQVNSFCPEVTHMVVSTNRGKIHGSVEVLHAILRGKWILRSEWVEKSLSSTQVADCAEYEVNGTLKYPDSHAPRKGRENAEKMQPSLFSGCYFYLCTSSGNKFHVDDLVISKAELSMLIKAGGGELLTREPDPEAIPERENTVPYHASHPGPLSNCSHYIIYKPGPSEPLIKYKMPHVKSLPVTWLMKCIETFSFIEDF